MEGKQQIFAANKLVTTVGAISFTDEEIVAQSDIDLIGSEVDTLIVESTSRSMKNSSPLDQVTWTIHDTIIAYTPIPEQ